MTQKRKQFPPRFEQDLQRKIAGYKVSHMEKIEAYRKTGNFNMLRKLQREIWAFVGVQDHGLDIQTLMIIHTRYVRLDMVPTHYHFPEFYLVSEEHHAPFKLFH